MPASKSIGLSTLYSHTASAISRSMPWFSRMMRMSPSIARSRSSSTSEVAISAAKSVCAMPKPIYQWMSR